MVGCASSLNPWTLKRLAERIPCPPERHARRKVLIYGLSPTRLSFFSSGMSFLYSGREKSHSVDQNFINGKQKSYSGELIWCMGTALLLSRIRNRCTGKAIPLSGREILHSRMASLPSGKALRDSRSA
jgi:hypothetical protein